MYSPAGLDAMVRAMRSLLRATLVSCVAAASSAQGPPANGPVVRDPGFHALVGGTVVVQPGERIENATLVLRDGRIAAVGPALAAPAGARVHDCTGLTLYAGLIEPLLPVDAPAPDPDGPLGHWHPMVLPQRSALDGDGATADDRRALRKLGFAAAAIAPTGGVFKGSAALVLLDEPEAGRRARVVRERVYSLCSLQTSGGGHPTSQMGAIALLRQTLSDADWFARCSAAAQNVPALRERLPAPSAALAALSTQNGLPLAFDVVDELELLRTARVAAEAGRQAFVFGSGMEFRRIEAVAAARVPVVVPVHFPEAPDVSTLGKAQRVSLRQLQTWEQAPTNLKRLLDAGVRVALTSARLPERKEFHQQLREALRCGVTADQALAALTTVPAGLLGAADDLGTLQPGRIANVVVVDGDLFDAEGRIRDVWVAGVRHEVEAAPVRAFDGVYTAMFSLATDATAELTVRRDKVGLKIGERKVEARGVALDAGRLEFSVEDDELARAAASDGGPLWCRLQRVDGALVGTAHRGDGRAFAVRAERTGDAPPPEPKDEKALPVPSLDPLPVPLGGYGLLTAPAAETVLFRGGTVWTCGPLGVVPFGAVLIRDGRIVFAGPATELPQLPPSTRVVDCTGKHLTPGLIDCHSHTGISRGINEGGEAVTAEVRVQDVVDPDDVNWYRQLAGGVTAVNQLHGSANAIGGQSNVVKLRWGARHPDDMGLQGSVPGIKFALGENPRGANSSRGNGRYPNTRMGVEALIRDRFLAAADYRKARERYEALPPKERAATLPPRRDLELEALAEVLAGARRVHCHSYRQDEIFMLCGLAKEFGFRIGTFQHVLEGYKVAEAIRDAAYGASSFSDWWAYKFEVYDAIPENGAILHEVGVNVSFNSDSNEHARRLNTEAGKAVRYGGVAPAEALKFVTANPAFQLGVEASIGSLERGKDADVAIWSGDPLSYASVCEQTWIDGRLRFSRADDLRRREAVASERQRLLALALRAAQKRGKTAKEDARDAYWAAEDTTADYCCRTCEEGVR